MKKIILVLFIAGIATLIASYAYLYYATKGGVDSLIAYLQPYVSIKYKKFHNPMDGSISINGVSISSAVGFESHIESIELRLNGIFDFINFEKNITDRKIVPKLQIKLNHAHMDLKSVVDMLNYKQSVFNKILQHVAAQGCGDTKLLTPKYIPELGYTEFDGSINLNYEYDEYSSLVNITFDFIWHDMTSYSFRTSVPNINSYSDFANPNNEVNSFQFVVQDLGYNQRYIEFCSEKSGIDSDEYVDHHIKRLQNYLLQASVSFSDDIYEAYREYLLNDAPVTFDINPESAVNLEYIHLFKPSDWPTILGLDINVGENRIKDLSMSWDAATSVKYLLNIKPRKIKEKHKKAFTQVAPSEIANYVYSNVQIETIKGKKYKGVLIGIENNDIILKLIINRIKIEAPVNINQIASASVYK
jgi:small nuclear ribonucleoprotein (snRNP)-like protein